MKFPQLAALVIVCAAFAVRLSGLEQMQAMLLYDEAYNLLDAESLLAAPRLTPFMPANNGRESLWFYLIAFFLANGVDGGTTIRLLPALVGTLCVAAVVPLARAVFGRSKWLMALVSAAFLAGLYPHLHIGHLGLRANLLPLFGTLFLAAWLQARVGRRAANWLLAGAFLGALGYTYFSALAWLPIFVLVLVVDAIVSRQRRGAAIALIVALAMWLPLIVYGVQNPVIVFGRFSQVGTAIEPVQIVEQTVAWLGALYGPGDRSDYFNVPYKPMLDLGRLLLVLGGVGWLAWRNRPGLLALVTLALAAIAPSVLSEYAPNYLRGLGVVIPLALVAGAGVGWMGVPRLTLQLKRLLSVMVMCALAVGGWLNHVTFTQTWLNLPEVANIMEQHFIRGMAWIAANDGMTPVYVSPYQMGHPVMQLKRRSLAAVHVAAFDSQVCEVMGSDTSTYLSLSAYEPDRLARLQARGVAQEMHGIQTQAGLPFAKVFRSTLDQSIVARRGDVFGLAENSALHVALAQPLPNAVERGGRLNLVLQMRAERTIGVPLSAFVHLYSIPTPYKSPSGRLLSQVDAQLCNVYPTTLWRSHEQPAWDIVFQNFGLPIPSDMPPGLYQIGLGIYESPDGERLVPLGADADSRNNKYIVLHTILVN